MKPATLNRLLHLWANDRDNFLQKIRKKIRNKAPIDKMFFQSGLARPPINLTFEMTHLCNLSCYMCDLYGTDSETDVLRSQTYKPDELMDLEDLKRILDEVKTFKPSISLTGGEPVLSPLTLPFIQHASELGLVVTMTTNGYRLSEIAGDLVSSGLRNMTLSIDGVGAVHDHVRGKQSSFETAIRGLEALQSEKKRRKSALPMVQFNVTMCGRNQDQLLPILQLAHDQGVNRVIYSHLWYWDEKMVKHHNQVYGHIAPVEIQNIKALEQLSTQVLKEEVSKIRTSPLNRQIDVKFLPDLLPEQIDRYYHDSLAAVRPTEHCLAPWMNTRILPNGDMIPCIDSMWGNLKSMSFSDAWNSKEARRFRSSLKDQGVFSGCMRCCGLYSYE